MKTKLLTLFLAILASVGIASAAITVRLDPSSCSSWSTVFLWAWTSQGDLFNSWPGIALVQDETGWYSYTFDEDITSVNIIWNNGTDQTVDIERVTSSTCYALNSTTGTNITVSVVDCTTNETPDPNPTPNYERVQIDNLYYNLDATNKTAEVTSQNSSYPYWSTTITTANIPSSVTYNEVTYSVTSIGERAFDGCGLTSVTIPNSVTSIGQEAFSDCNSLTSVTIPISVTSIGSSAFENCTSLTSVTIPNSVTSIGEDAFSSCSSLTSVTIPNSVTSIGNSAFFGCSGLTSVTIGNSVTSIGGYAFSYCNSLTSVTLNSNAVASKNYSSDSTLKNIFGTQVTEYIIGDDVTSIGSGAFQGCSGLTSVTIPNSVTIIADDAFNNCSSLTSVTLNSSVIVGKTYTVSSNIKNIFGSQVTEYIIGDDVTTIGAYAFSWCTGLTSVTIPNSVTSIGEYAFMHCESLTSIEIPNSVTSIGDDAFAYCSGLTSVTIPNSVTSIGEYAFYGCTSLTSIEIPNSVTSIEFGAFEGCSSLTSVTIPNSVTSIGNLAFNRCSSLTSVTIPNSVTSIGASAFSWCTGLTSVTIPNSVTSIGSGAFQGCSGLTSVTIPNSVTSIGRGAFEYCSGLTSITIPNSVTSIGDDAFELCSGLTSVTIPNSVTSIGNYAFNRCSSLTSVTIKAETPPTLGSYVFSETNNCPIYVPCNSVSTYKSDWSEYASRILASPNCVQPQPETDNYVVLAQRNATSNWFYMTSDLGTASNKRYQAVDAGTTSLANVNTSNLESKYYWQIEENKLHTAAGYSTWESGNTAILDETGKELNIEKQTDGTYTFSFADGTNTRYLSLNTNVGNNYFAYYRGTNQIYKLTLVKEGERGTTTAIEEIASQQETQSATKVLRNGQILILRGDKTYTTDGRLVR